MTDQTEKNLEYWKSRALNFENAGTYDKERHSPASEEAHEIWAHIVDKPHHALKYIQRLIDERDTAADLLETFCFHQNCNKEG